MNSAHAARARPWPLRRPYVPTFARTSARIIVVEFWGNLETRLQPKYRNFMSAALCCLLSAVSFRLFENLPFKFG